MDTQNWAAWVQAVGSILAILGSAWIGWWLHRLQVKAEKSKLLEAHLEEVQRTRRLLLLAERTIEKMHKLMGSVEHQEVYYRDVAPHEHVPELHEGMGYLSSKDAPTAELLMQLIAAKNAFNNFYSVYRQGKYVDSDDYALAATRQHVETSLETVSKAADGYKQYVRSQRARAAL